MMGSWTPGENVAFHELKILLVGLRRTGKSSSGNTLLGQAQVFETRGGEASTAASAITAGHHVTVVDAQGWSSCEEFVPREEKIALLRALSLCGLGGPHVILLVIPLLDFTESERRAVERRMEILTSAVWRHTMVLFTCGDWLRRRRRTVQEHVKSGGAALHWLMEKCCYRYHVFDNETAGMEKQDRSQQELNGGKKKGRGAWWKKTDKEAGRRSTEGEADGRKDGEQEQVIELLSKVEDMLLENGGWHFSLHMYQRMEEEWSRREQELRARLKAERCRKCEEKTNVEQEQRLERKEDGEDCEERKMFRGEDTEEVKRLSSEDDSWETSSDSGGDSEDSTEVKTGTVAPFRSNGCQRLTASPITRLA